MLAAIGFITTGIIVSAFAGSFEDYVAKPYKLDLWQFSGAYYCLATAFTIWGVASLSHSADTLKFAVLVGDGLLIAGTVLLLSLVTPARYVTKLTLVETLVGIALLCQRAVFYVPAAKVQNGILLFNTQRPVAIAIGLALALIWLPVNVRVARVVTEAVKQPSVTQLYTTLYVAGVLAALLFLSTRRFAAVVLSFSALALVFVLLVASNYAIRSLKRPRGHHAK